MKYPDKELQTWLEAFSSYSEDELISEMQKSNPESAKHRATKILLNKKDKKETEERHLESLEESRQANRLSRIAIFIAILSLIVAIIAFSYKKQSTSQETPKIESRKPSSTSVPPSNSKLPIQQGKGLEGKQQK
jgi:hypothetical protein